ncbi:hypothetical protein ASPFODRAFT_55192 [Aspergillus luchuensis CBS 106.47]|uniref:ATPase AAA-type core domain-containing protein n=1 Tax=Aspergillus luchuensis (strain CBS 106.47) TaxID=1137211 RepID=A0A1M3SYA8_ASPLC|nr:hypothetical protein ASPFODRAFT_55192 [Aspergillus luchuensis CBS 106.47]
MSTSVSRSRQCSRDVRRRPRTKALKWKRTVQLSSNGVALCALLYRIHDVTARGDHILIMTTNVIKQLNNALLCPGRIDMESDFGYGCLGTIRTSFTQPPPGTSWVFWALEDSFAHIPCQLARSRRQIISSIHRLYSQNLSLLVGTVQQWFRLTFGSTEIVL